ncbi:MAG: hypothetical protein M0R38_09865 [Bacteroidia bacterium]|nr:hypothetical protein [Bacteroidia bacterium]
MKAKCALFLFTFISLVVISCNNQAEIDYEKQRSLEYIDSLQSDLLEIKQKLDGIDFEEIAHRKQYILSEIKLIQEAVKPEQRSEELSKILTDYHGFFMMYENLDKNIETIVKESEELFIQTRTLKQSVENGDYGKEDFKKYLKAEAKEIAQLKTKSAAILDPVIESENMFLKRMEKLEEISKSLKIDSPTPKAQ